MSHKIRYHFSNAAFICLTKALWDNNIIDKVDDDFIFHIWFTCHIRAFIVLANLRWKRLGHWKDKSYKIWYWITFEHQRPSSTSFLPPWRIQVMERLIFLYAALDYWNLTITNFLWYLLSTFNWKGIIYQIHAVLR